MAGNFYLRVNLIEVIIFQSPVYASSFPMGAGVLPAFLEGTRWLGIECELSKKYPCNAIFSIQGYCVYIYRGSKAKQTDALLLSVNQHLNYVCQYNSEFIRLISWSLLRCSAHRTKIHQLLMNSDNKVNHLNNDNKWDYYNRKVT